MSQKPSPTLSDEPLERFLERNLASVRAIRSVGSAQPLLFVSDYQRDPKNFELRLLMVPNLGRKTQCEIISLLKENVELASSGEDGNASTILPVPKPIQEEWRSLEDEIAILLVELDHKRSFTLKMRLGLAGQREHTLEEVGESLHLTRERVRQLQKKAIHRFKSRLSNRQEEISQRLRAEVWALAGGSFLQGSEIADVLSQASDIVKILIAAFYGSGSELMDAEFPRFENGWAASEQDKADAQQVREQLEIALEANKPEILSEIFDGKLLGVARQAAKLIRGYAIYGGFIVRGAFTKRTRRVANIHALLGATSPLKPLSEDLLVSQYCQAFPEDQCSLRDLEYVMAIAKHLFINMQEEGWLALPPYVEHLNQVISKSAGAKEEVNRQDAQEEGYESEVQSIADKLEELIRANGPMPFDELRYAFIKCNPDNSMASVGPILITSGRFTRAAPGVYALRSNISASDQMVRAMEVATNEWQCQTYCQAIWAGERADLYPIWGPQMELRWADFLSKESGCSASLYSLLAVTEPENWPINETLRLHWAKQKRTNGQYQLREEISVSLTETIPDFRDVAVSALHAMNNGGISWVSINRVCGLRVDDRHAHTMLVLLYALGVIKNAEHWQDRHHFREGARAIVLGLLERTRIEPQSKWSYQQLSVLDDIEIELSDGWIIKENVETVLNEVRGRYFNSMSSEVEFTKGDYENIQEEILRRRRQRRIERL